jgi:hypothetical protein
MADYPDLAGTASRRSSASSCSAQSRTTRRYRRRANSAPLGIVATSVSLCAMTSFASLVLPVARSRAGMRSSAGNHRPPGFARG